MCRRLDIESRVKDNISLEYRGFVLKNGIPSPCHIWKGSNSGCKRGDDYPRMSLDGVTVAVHRVVYTNVNGLIPSKKQIDHLCNNTMCVNNLHLEMVSHKENQKRRVSRRLLLAA